MLSQKTRRPNAFHQNASKLCAIRMLTKTLFVMHLSLYCWQLLSSDDADTQSFRRLWAKASVIEALVLTELNNPALISIEVPCMTIIPTLLSLVGRFCYRQVRKKEIKACSHQTSILIFDDISTNRGLIPTY